MNWQNDYIERKKRNEYMKGKMNEEIKKVVFRETEESKPKVLYGTVKDLDSRFFEVTTTLGNIFMVNKHHVVYIKEGEMKYGKKIKL